jgi:hypothetical protein
MPKVTEPLTVRTVGGSVADRVERAHLVTRSLPALAAAALDSGSAAYAPGIEPLRLAINAGSRPAAVAGVEAANRAVILGHCHPDETVAILSAADAATVMGPGFNTMGVAKSVISSACPGEVDFFPAGEAHRYTWAEMTELINLFPNGVELSALRFRLLGSFFLTRAPATLRDNQTSFERMLDLKLAPRARLAFEQNVARRLAKHDVAFASLSNAVAAVSATDPDMVATVLGCYQHTATPPGHDMATIGKLVFAELVGLKGYTVTLPDYDGSAITAMLAKAAGLEPPDKETHRSLVKHALTGSSPPATTELFAKYAAAAQKTHHVVYADPGLCPTLDDLFALAVMAAVAESC